MGVLVHVTDVEETAAGNHRAVCSCGWRDKFVAVPQRFEDGKTGAIRSAMLSGTAHRRERKGAAAL